MPAMPVKVLCDSCADLPQGLLAARGISQLGLTVTFGSEQFVDGVDINAAEFYARVQREGIIPTTSQLTPVQYARFFGDAVADGSEAVYIALSSGLSGSCQNARLAASDPDLKGRVHVVDSLGASVGLGLMVLRAADLADSGVSAAQIAGEIESFRTRVCHLFTLDTLDFARKSGRVSRFSAIAAGMLDIKPVLNVDMEGHLIPFDKIRGRKRAINRLFEEMERLGANVAGQRVGVNHAMDLATAEAMAERLRTQCGAGEVVIGEIGPTIGSHVGPGCVSIFFEGPVNRGY